MKKAFIFSLPSTKGDQFDLKKIKENVVIYFYPKDDTPGCTLETKDFSKLYKEFKKAPIRSWSEQAALGQETSGVKVHVMMRSRSVGSSRAAARA